MSSRCRRICQRICWREVKIARVWRLTARNHVFAIAQFRWQHAVAPSVMLASGIHQESDGHALHLPVLVLNASYEPINVCAARRAIVLVLKGVAMTEEENGHFLHAARLAVRVPSVIRLLEYRRIPHQTRALSRKNILLRDRNICQYCGAVLSAAELTL